MLGAHFTFSIVGPAVDLVLLQFRRNRFQTCSFRIVYKKKWELHTVPLKLNQDKQGRRENKYLQTKFCELEKIY